jgi:hypothetical protein
VISSGVEGTLLSNIFFETLDGGDDSDNDGDDD